MSRELEIVNGCLLGDAGLVRRGRNPYFWVDLSGGEHLDWLYVMKETLQSMGIPVTDKCPKITPRQHRLRGKMIRYTEVALWSSSSPLLLPLYHEWYPGGHKVVPRSLGLTPITIAHWFMGDGSSWALSGRPNLVRAKFCTNGLPLADIDRLGRMLAGMGIVAVRYESDPVLFVNDAISIIELMDTVKPYLVPSFQYKLKYPKLKAKPTGPRSLSK